MGHDLTIGKPSKVLWLFCLPLFGSIIFQQLYNIADSLVAGKFIGEEALAAVGNGYEITLIFLAFAFGCNIGCSVVSSRLYGEKKYNDVKSCISTAFISTIIISIFLTVLGYFFSKPLLKLINTPDNIMEESSLYLDIYIYGLIFVFIYNVSTGIFSSLGDSKTPFIFLALSSVSNIFVDKFFSIQLLKKMAIIAIPSTIQQSFISVGNILIQGIINSFGSSAIAGYSAAVKLNNLMITSLTTVGNGLSNYTAQNLGSSKINRIHEGFKAGIKMVIILCIPFTLIYFFIGKYLLYLFMDSSSNDALSNGLMFLRIISPFYFIVAIKLVADGILRGTSNMLFFMIATLTDLILRVSLAFILSNYFGTNGIWISWPIGWFISMILSVLFYYIIMKKYKMASSK